MATMDKAGVTEIKIGYPDAGDLQLSLKLGACRLNVKPGTAQDWVNGTYDEAESGINPLVQQQGGTTTIAQEWKGLHFPGWLSRAPTFDLELGKAKPFKFSLDSGAGESALELGGLPINRMVINHGAGRMKLSFAQPNPVEMSLLRIAAGASDFEIAGLANANCAELSLEGGAARYVVDFAGTLKRDMHAQVKVGAAAVELHLPKETPVKITHESFLGGLEVADGFMRKDGAFYNQVALGGKTPLLNIHANLALGSLKVVNV